MTSQLRRQVFVTLAMLTCTIGALTGLGILGRTVRDSVHGTLSADATLIAPAQPAFRIWQLIWLGLLAYVVWQWFPRHARRQRDRSVGWLAGLSMLLNGAWIFVTQYDLIWVSFAIMGVLLATLVWIMVRLQQRPARSLAERIIVDGTFGLYLGWTVVATFANIAAVGAFLGWDLGSTGNQATAVAMLAAAAAAGIGLALWLGARLAVALGMVWGLFWISLNRLTDLPYSPAVGATAAFAAVLVLAGTALIRGLAPLHAQRRAALKATALATAEPTPVKV